MSESDSVHRPAISVSGTTWTLINRITSIRMVFDILGKFPRPSQDRNEGPIIARLASYRASPRLDRRSHLKRKAKNVWMILGVLAAVLLIPVAILLCISGWQVEKRIAAIRDGGDPLELIDLAPSPLPEDQNAAVFFEQARSDLRAINQGLARLYDSTTLKDGRPTNAEIEAVQTVLQSYPDVLPLLERAANAPNYASLADYTVDPMLFFGDVLLPTFSDMRSAARFLTARSLVLLHGNEPDRALHELLLLFRLCRHFDCEPTLAALLTSLGCRALAVHSTNMVLQRASLTAESYRALETELAFHDLISPLVRAIEADRVFTLATYHSVSSKWPARVSWDYDMCQYLDSTEVILTLVSQPYSVVKQANVRPRLIGGILPPMLSSAITAISQTRISTERFRAKINGLRILNALKARRDLVDEQHPNLSQLGLPPDAITDPFDGQELRLRKVTEGWLIYSVGENLQDDGGAIASNEDIGLEP